MELFKIFGTLALVGVAKAKQDLSDIGTQAEQTSQKASNSLGRLGQAIVNNFKTESPIQFGDAVKGLGSIISSQESKLVSLKAKYMDLAMTQGKESDEAKQCAKEIGDLSKELKDNKSKLADAEASADKFDKQLEEVGKTSNKTASKLSKIGGVAKLIGKGLLVATGAVATGAVALVKKVSSSYGRLQQSIGGIETLFKDSAQKVIENANNAYTTAGIDANTYMEQITSFSASLLQALGGDTEKACNSADMAIRDMADNANKMGTYIGDIQNAYQGFAKQNYTMLDNLKLGYGGTKTEMERLLADAEKITGIKYDISNLNDVYQAIHVIQGELGITGTTAQEAGETIEGSFNSLSASWQNFIAGLGNPDADMKKLVENLAKGISGAVQNVIPVINNMVEVLPTVMDALIDAISQMLPTLIQTFTDLITKVIDAIVQLLPEFIPLAVDCILTVAQALIENLPLIVEAGIQLIVSLGQGLVEALPTLVPVIVEVIIKITDTLIDNLGLLVSVAVQLILALVEGMINAMPIIADNIPIIIESVNNALIDAFPTIIEAGVKLIFSLIEGLLKAIPSLIGMTPKIISGIIRGLLNGAVEFFNLGGRLLNSLINGMKSKGSGIIDFFSNIVDNISGLWGKFCDWFKSIFKLPHFTTKGSWNPKDWFTQGLPSIGVEWYAKGGVMTEPTAFGYNPSTGSAMIGGEAGNEAIAPISTLQQYISEAVKKETDGLGYYFDKLIDLLGTYLPDITDNMGQQIVLDSGQLVGAMASKMDSKLGDLASAKSRYRG